MSEQESLNADRDLTEAHRDLLKDHGTECYREGFSDGLRWVLGNLELTPEDEQRIEEALDA